MSVIGEKDTWVFNYLNEIEKKKRKIIMIYGAGRVAAIIYNLCHDFAIAVNGFCVTSLEGNFRNINGLPVYQFNQLKFSPEEVLVLVGIKERAEHRIKVILESAGWYNYVDTPDEIFLYESWESSRKKRPALEITPKIGCSINCKYCPQELLILNYYKNSKNRKSSMSLQDFMICIDKLPSNILIEFAGFVEPFLNPESIDMIEYANKKGYDLTLFTTLVGLSEDDFHRLKKIPFRQVILHLPDIKGYAHIPITSSYLELLKMVIGTLKVDGSPFVDSANCQGVPHPDILKLTKDKLRISGELNDRAGNIFHNAEVDISSSIFKRGMIICDRADNLDHNILLPDGTVVLCCNDFGMQHILGNLLKDSYDSIVDNEVLKDIKYNMTFNESVPILCRRCIYAVQKGDKKDNK